jgi:LmbE family N-acetylglucosaminyl deacetylase
VAYLTNGEHNQFAFIVFEKRIPLKKNEFIHLGEVRKSEAIKAMKLLGLGEDNLIFLGYPDFMTFAILSKYWQSNKPAKSSLTRISSVPYKDSLSFGAPYTGESILGDIKKVILSTRPNKIFVSHPADVNADHKSLYLFLQVALSDLNKAILQPKIYPYLIHCVAWPMPRRYHPELNLEPPQKFLDASIGWVKFKLTQDQLDKKHKAILCYKSQTESSAFYLLTFARQNELFGDYEKIDLKPQPRAPIKEKGILFFGLSKIYRDSSINTDLSEPAEKEGEASFAIADNTLLVRINKKENIKKKFGLILYIFGYNDKTQFAAMPKITLITNYNRIKIFNGRKKIDSSGVTLDLNSHEAVLKIPLRLLGDPNFILVSIKTHGATFDAMGFRKINIK